MTMLTFEKKGVKKTTTSCRVQKGKNDPQWHRRTRNSTSWSTEQNASPSQNTSGSSRKRSSRQNCFVNWLCKSTLFDFKCHPKCQAADKWASQGKAARDKQVVEANPPISKKNKQRIQLLPPPCFFSIPHYWGCIFIDRMWAIAHIHLLALAQCLSFSFILLFSDDVARSQLNKDLKLLALTFSSSAALIKATSALDAPLHH